MKRLLIPMLILTGVFISNATQAQVYVQSHIGFGVPVHRGYYAPPPPPVVYEDNYAPAYSDDYLYDNNVVIVGGPGHRYERRHRDYDDRYYRGGYERREYRHYDRDRGWDRGRERYHGNEGRHGRGW